MKLEECRKVAEDVIKGKVKINKTYTLGDAYVFDSKQEWIGVMPLVVDFTGKTDSLWHYLNEKDLTMDDMVEV